MDSPIRLGEFLFVRDFDSANLGHVEQVTKEEILSAYKTSTIDTPSYEFNVWTRPDCAATEFENGNRTWFYFGIQSSISNTLVKLNIVNLNRQGKMYSQGMAPVTKTVPGKSHWERIKEKPTFNSTDSIFTLSFKFRTPENKNAITYFAFTYPYSYSELQTMLNSLDLKFQLSASEDKDDDIYYHRECVCYSLEKRRVDLITITSRYGITNTREKRLKNLFPEAKERPFLFKNKKVIFVSARVHPGETPSSFVFNGLLNLLVNRHDPTAVALRRQFVFKMIPFLNPDGVVRGHYRTDTRGLNLNRMYLSPTIELHPTVYAARAVIRYHHFGEERDDDVETKPFTLQNLSKSAKQVNWLENTKRKKVNHFNEKTNITIKNCKNIIDSKKSSKISKENELITSALNTSLTSKVEDLNLNDIGLSSDGISESSSLFLESKDDNADVICGKLVLNKDKGSDIINTFSIHSDSDKNLNNNFWCDSCKKTVYDLEWRMPGITNMLPSTCQEKVSTHSMKQYCVNCHNSIEVKSTTENNIQENECEINLTDVNKNRPIKISSKCNQPKMAAKKKVNEPKDFESGLFLYIDLHGHASKKGIFMYGNHFDDIEKSVDCMLLPRIMSLNNCHFHFSSCNFTERNMYLKDRRDGMSREGSGRVAVLKVTGLLRSYTLECNYNTGRMLNVLPPTAKEGQSPGPMMPSNGMPPKYTPQLFEEVGKSLGTSLLDLTGNNPNSRIPCSDHRNLNGIKEWLRSHLRHSRPNQAMLTPTRQTSSRTPRTQLPRSSSKSSKKNNFTDNERKENLLGSFYQSDSRSSQSKIGSRTTNIKLLGMKSRNDQALSAKSQRNLSLIKKPSVNKQAFKQALRKPSPSSRARIVQKLKLSESSDMNKNLDSFKGVSKSNPLKQKQSKYEGNKSSIPISSSVQKKLKLKMKEGSFQFPNKSATKRLKISQILKYNDNSKLKLKKNKSEIESVSSSNSSAEDTTLSWDTIYPLSAAGSSSCASDAGPSTKISKRPALRHLAPSSSDTSNIRRHKFI